MATNVFKKSIVWGKSYELTRNVYAITKYFPSEEKYSLTAQIRRAAVSITSNIAEGLLRDSPIDFARFLTMAKGSCGELLTQLMLARDFKYIHETEFQRLDQQINEITRILFATIKTIKSRHY